MKEYKGLDIEVVNFDKADVVVASSVDSEHDNGYIDWGDFL